MRRTTTCDIVVAAMNDQLAALRLFVRVARTGSFSRAARELATTQPTASRTIAALEKALGAALFTRSTRALTLTEAGTRYLERVEPLLAALDEADQEALGTGELRGLTVNMRDISDTMPTLAAIAPFADGPVRIEDVANTRVKECDRLEACAENLRRLGVEVATGPDWIEIRPDASGSPAPGAPTGADIKTYGDHRIVMSFAVTGLRVPGISFDDPGCVRKTFPGFHEAFGQLAKALRKDVVG